MNSSIQHFNVPFQRFVKVFLSSVCVCVSLSAVFYSSQKWQGTVWSHGGEWEVLTASSLKPAKWGGLEFAPLTWRVLTHICWDARMLSHKHSCTAMDQLLIIQEESCGYFMLCCRVFFCALFLSAFIPLCSFASPLCRILYCASHHSHFSFAFFKESKLFAL